MEFGIIILFKTYNFNIDCIILKKPISLTQYEWYSGKMVTVLSYIALATLTTNSSFFSFLKNTYLFYLAMSGLSCGLRDFDLHCNMQNLFFFSFCMWDLVSWPGLVPGSPALGVLSLSPWITSEVPLIQFSEFRTLFIHYYFFNMNKGTIKQEPNNKFNLFGYFCLLFYNCVCVCVCVCAKSFQSCLTLWDPMDCSLPRSSVYGILQATIEEWVAISSLFIFNQINAFSKWVNYLT